jgi:hypothetical protein
MDGKNIFAVPQEPFATFILPQLNATRQATTKSNIVTNNRETQFQRAYLGLGIGMDYGGIGIKAEVLPSKYVSLFGGLGIALIDPAYNVGASLRIFPELRAQPILIAMYGYNAVLYLKNNSGLSKIYYGATAGVGNEFHFGRKDNKATFAILFPFRSAAFRNRYNELERQGYQFNPDILPVAFSLGCNFAFQTKTSRKKYE